jgi:mxaJ protein
VHAVATGEVDVGRGVGTSAPPGPRAGSGHRCVSAVSPRIDLPFLPFVFDIASGVAAGDTALRDALDARLLRRRATVDALLASYGVPRVP